MGTDLNRYVASHAWTTTMWLREGALRAKAGPDVPVSLRSFLAVLF